MRGIFILLLLCFTAIRVFAYDGQADFSGWYVSPSIGGVVTHRNFPAKTAPLVGLQLGYDVDEYWSAELGLWMSPARSRADDPMTLTQGTLDGLYHFLHWEALDPYLFIGAGIFHSDVAVFDSCKTSLGLRLGGGAFYYFSDRFALRAGLGVTLCSYKARVAAMGNAGVTWSF